MRDKQHRVIQWLSLIALSLALLPQRVFAQFGTGIEPPFQNDYAPSDLTTDTTAFSVFETIVSNVIGLLTVVGSLVFIVYFLLGAISWISSGGDTSKVGKARDQMVQGALGLVILVMMYAIVGLIGSIVGIDILNPATILTSLVQ